ncbi:hypothetical protein ACHAXT_008163 [Thalassiosira profunda]
MEKEYEVPIANGAEKRPPPSTTTSGSVASSSRVASVAASAPVRLGGGRLPPNVEQRLSFADAQSRSTRSGTATPDGDSFNSSPLLWNGNSPQRMRSRREFEQKIRHRRARPHTLPKFDSAANLKKDADGKEGAPKEGGGNPLVDLLLQTAMLGIDTTAKLSRPTLELTKNTLLPQLIVPLVQEVWEQYVPDRAQTWMKVVPTSLKNVGDLLWDTEAGHRLGEKGGQLGESVVDMASSEVARQLWIDVTVGFIKLLEGLHTPEVKALLDQFAVGMCRFVDVLSSGKAKQVWFDLSETIWALIEVGGDPVMVTALADGCAKICFALEREREALKARRAQGEGASGDDNRAQQLFASKRRRDRETRQAGTYPPGKRVVIERGGVEGFEEALLAGLDGVAREREENGGDNVEDQIYNDIDYGPPERVLVPSNSMEDVGETGIDPTADDDNESEITTEIEDLGDSNRVGDVDDVDKSSASDKQTDGQRLAYEKDDRNTYAGAENQADDLEWRPNDDGTASEMYDAFGEPEPILHFYRRLNEVLVATRKGSNLEMPPSDEPATTEETLGRDAIVSDAAAAREASPPPSAAPKGPLGVRKRWWKLVIIAIILGVASMCTLWFALGCYGFYVLVIGGGQAPALFSKEQQPNVVIQLVGAGGQEGAGECNANSESGGVASLTLEDWKKLQRDVDKIMSQTSEEKASGT